MENVVTKGLDLFAGWANLWMAVSSEVGIHGWTGLKLYKPPPSLVVFFPYPPIYLLSLSLDSTCLM